MTEAGLFKILTESEWKAFRQSKTYDGGVLDRQDGFIHLSKASQVAGTLDKHFHGQQGLVLVELDGSGWAGALKWELSRGDEMFPHLYQPLSIEDVKASYPLPLDGQSRHILPAQLRGDRDGMD